MKYIFLLFSLPVMFYGCAKQEEPFQSYLRMTIDDEAIACDQRIQASSYFGLGPTQLLSISGYWRGSNRETNAVEIELYDFNNTPGERLIQSPSLVTLWYQQHDGSGGVISETYFARESGNSRAKINILEVTEKYVKGTFECVALSSSGPGTKTVTNGTFHIQR